MPDLPSESQLAPNSFEEFVGQDRTKRRVQLAIKAAKQRGESLGHVLLIGPPGFGKATLARIIRDAVGAKTIFVSGMSGGNGGDFAGLLTQLDNGDVLFIEDIHTLDRNVAEFLRQPMNDFNMNILIDGGRSAAQSVRLNLPRFTLVAAATRKDRISPGFFSSFPIVEEFSEYRREELAEIARRFARVTRVCIDREVAGLVSRECVSPRDVLNRFWHLRDYIDIETPSVRVTARAATEAFSLLPPNPMPTLPAKQRISRKEENVSSDPLKRRYQVFVSSTYDDLKEERRQIMQALLETKCIPTGMELFPAASEEQWSLIKRVIDDCDYYLVVVAGHYGSIGSNGKSYTEMEFEYATALGKSVLGFYHADPDSLPGRNLEKGDERRKKLAAFTKKVKMRICKPWSTAEGLASAIKSAILHAIENDRKPGWIRASDLPSTAAIESLKRSAEPGQRRRR